MDSTHPDGSLNDVVSFQDGLASNKVLLHSRRVAVVFRLIHGLWHVSIDGCEYIFFDLQGLAHDLDESISHNHSFFTFFLRYFLSDLHQNLKKDLKVLSRDYILGELVFVFGLGWPIDEVNQVKNLEEH